MGVDVVTETTIARPVADVAGFAADPSNAPAWYDNIKSIEWVTDPGVQVGAKMKFVAQFLGRRLEYTYEIIEFVEAARLMMRTAQGPFPMETTYTWEPTDDGSCRMTLRNRGEPVGFSKVMVPLMVPAMRRANGKDLAKLRAILESSPPS